MKRKFAIFVSVLLLSVLAIKAQSESNSPFPYYYIGMFPGYFHDKVKIKKIQLSTKKCLKQN